MPSITTPLSPYREVDVVPAWVALGDHTITASWWGVPVYVVRQWITSALRKSDYRTAAAFSALLPRPAGLVKAAPLVVCTRSLTLGGVTPESDDDLLSFRMRLSGRKFRRGLPSVNQELLPLV